MHGSIPVPTTGGKFTPYEYCRPKYWTNRIPGSYDVAIRGGPGEEGSEAWEGKDVCRSAVEM